jgi:hypothetical protein
MKKNSIILLFLVIAQQLSAQLKVLNNGYVGAGTLSPISNFQVGNQISKLSIGSCYSAAIGYGNSYIGFNLSRTSSGTWTAETDGANNGGAAIFGDIGGSLLFTRVAIVNGSQNQTGIPDAQIAGNVTMKICPTGQIVMGGITPLSSYKLTVYGSAYASGGSWVASDVRYKQNIKPIDDALNKVLKLNGKSYKYKTNEFKEKDFSTKLTLGFIAQELKEILPEAVDQDKDGYFSINYDEVIPLLVEAIKEQHKIVQQLNEKVKTFESKNGIHPASDMAANSVEAKLYQNNPNPFMQSTEIKCIIPDESKNAEILIFDMAGKPIKQITITGKGEVTTLIQAFELKPGMYIYSLIVDNKEIDTKRMILSN